MLTKFEECISKMGIGDNYILGIQERNIFTECDKQFNDPEKAKAFFAMYVVRGIFEHMYGSLDLMRMPALNNWYERAEQLYDSLEQNFGLRLCEYMSNAMLAQWGLEIGISLDKESAIKVESLISAEDATTLNESFQAYTNASEDQREPLSDAYENQLMEVYLKCGAYLCVTDTEGVDRQIKNMTKILKLEDMLGIANQTVISYFPRFKAIQKRMDQDMLTDEDRAQLNVFRDNDWWCKTALHIVGQAGKLEWDRAYKTTKDLCKSVCDRHNQPQGRVDGNSASTSLSSGEVPNQGFLSSIVNLAYAIPGLLLSSLDRRDNSTPAQEQQR